MYILFDIKISYNLLFEKNIQKRISTKFKTIFFIINKK